jgi:hypothetical protein
MEGFSMFRRAVDLFTPDEHAILADWFRTKPPGCAQDILLQDAAKRLGFTKEPCHYLLNDAVVAYIVLEQVERQLPGWSAITDDGEFVTERHFRDLSAIPHRKVAVLPPRHLTINWADSGPGYSWPVAYYVAWLPYYDRFVVTASADCPEGFGYCDFAIGSFGIEKPLKGGARRVICDDWHNLRSAGEQQRCAYLFNTGLISEEEADTWAEEVWPSEIEIKGDAAMRPIDVE